MSQRRALVYVQGVQAALFEEVSGGGQYQLRYDHAYQGDPISLTLPVREAPYLFEEFPPFFDGLLPEGMQLEGLLRARKLDKMDYFGQLLAVGADMVGAVTLCEAPE